jgi:hypothetical protein
MAYFANLRLVMNRNDIENNPVKSSPDEKDIDLGVLFSSFIEIARKISSGFVAILRKCLSLLIWILLFLRRRILLLLTGLLLSLIPGIYIYLAKGPQYFSLMTVKANFGSAHNLYNKVEYFNSLIQAGENKKIAALFNISETDAEKLIRFEIRPFDDYDQAATVYRKYLYDSAMIGGPALARDSALLKLISFKDFKNSLQPYDYPLHEIKLVSRAPFGYNAIQAGLLSSISNNNMLQKKKQLFDSTHLEQTNVIRVSLANADSLMKAFNKQIASGTRAENGTNLTLSAQKTNNPEIEIFDQAVKLKNELGKLQTQDANQLDVLDVYADFNDTGTRVSIFKESFLTYSAWCLAGTLLLLLLLEAYTSIDAQEKKKRNA